MSYATIQASAGAGSSEPAISVTGLVKSFGDVRALDGVDLEAPAGAVLGLLGPNGAAGRTLADVVTNMLSVTVLIVTGLIIGFSFHASATEIVAGLGLLLLFGYAFSWVFALLGTLVSSPEAANSVGFIAVFPLTFISSAFVPVDSMPSALQAFAEINPFTVTVDAMRALWLGAPAGNSVWGAVAWSLAILAVFAPLAVARYRRAAGG